MTIQDHTKWQGIEAAEQLVAQVKTALPDVNLDHLSTALLKHLNPKPNYSTLTEPSVQLVKSTACGEFGLGYFYDPDYLDHNTKQKGSIMVALNKRPNRKDSDAPDLYACTGGGYMDLGGIDAKTGDPIPQEQPHEGAARELREETLDDQAHPVLDINPDRMQLIISGIDYQAGFGLPVHYSGYSFEMTPQEYKDMSTHADRLTSDLEYKEKVFENTNGEVTGYEVMPLSEALKIAPEKWAYPHEMKALRDFAELSQAQQQTRSSNLIS